MTAILSALNLVPKWLLAAALAALALSHCSVQRDLAAERIALSQEQRDHATTREGHAKTMSLIASAHASAERKFRQTIADLTGRLLEDAHETQQRIDQADRDLAAARDAGQRLRQQLAVLAARSCASAGTVGDPSAAAASPATQSAADLLADLQRRLDEASDDVAGFADRASAAGAACERAYGRARASLMKD